MEEQFATTPFGGRGVSRASMAVHQQLKRLRQQMGQPADCQTDRSCAAGSDSNASGDYDKWQLLKALTEARGYFGLSDRSLAVLEALTSFHTSKTLNAGAPIIVFPSNRALSLRCRGMSPATLRRHLAALVEAGLILRRDSPNGKRYVHRSDTGEIDQAFGFDLAALAAAAPDIHAAAERERARASALRKLRAEITIHLRDISKLLLELSEEAAAGSISRVDMTALFDRLTGLSGRVSRVTDLESLDLRVTALRHLRVDVETLWLESTSEDKLDELAASQEDKTGETLGNTDDLSGNDVQNAHHIQNSKPESHFDKQLKTNSEENPNSVSFVSLQTKSEETARGKLRAGTGLPTLGFVLKSCPQVLDYARSGISSWSELYRTADLVRTMLGVSPDAWAQANQILGEAQTAIIIAAILERADVIRSPGGYLRTLTERAAEGKFSIIPMLEALR
ncbi:Replication protein C C-terminal region/Replication protein C N-terminal domain (plasmid) [Hoeflea sp. IMCC20628]|uniref:plasmid replication protein RepC n=1 Tax=Hoeflea sp. IMCC20628 TaxID=1620421 RepID=UPI00063AA8D1|nr:plasmid replication protein RepC [Hoeflea sp. IMCC20628]AKI03427.1 Replication protein C C-terminal region/Replication protein C N-terminal domain [Hoeflea sp. IMCC20628]